MPIEIEDWNDLDDIREDLDEEYVLVNNLDSSTDGYEGIGDDWEPLDIFGGVELVIDGGGHTISDLEIDKVNDGVGFVSIVSNSDTKVSIEKLGFINPSVSNIGFDTSGSLGVGVFVGRVSDGEVSLNNCFVRGGSVNISGNNYFGTNYASGLVGIRGFGTVTIDKCYAVCECDAEETTGWAGTAEEHGIVGGTNTTSDSFWDTDVGPSSSDGGTGKTTAEMKDIDTYTDTATSGLDEAWDFTNIWSIDSEVNEGYPYFDMSEPVTGVTVKIKIEGDFEEKPLMIKKSGTFENVTSIQGGGWS